MKKDKKTSLKSMLFVSHIYLIGLIFIMVASLIMYFIALFAMDGTPARVLKIVFSVIFLNSVVGLFVAFIFFMRRSYRLFYHGVYENGMKNLEVIRDGKAEPLPLKEENIEEFKAMNDMFTEINSQLRGKVITTKEGDYSHLNLIYVNENQSLVTYDSLVNNLVNLIIATKSFRNAVLDISYGLLGEEMKQEDADRIVNNIKKGLDYPNLLIAANRRRNGFIVYVPVFDSISQLEEELWLEYLQEQVYDRVNGLESANIASVVEKVNTAGKHKIISKTTGGVADISLSTTSVIIGTTDDTKTETLTVNTKSSEGNIEYYAHVGGKYYKVIVDDNKVQIERNPSNIDLSENGNSNADGLSITFEDDTLATANIEGNTITITGSKIEGETNFTVRYGNSVEKKLKLIATTSIILERTLDGAMWLRFKFS